MTIQYTVTEKDFLTFQLFAASKSERITKSRRVKKVRVPIAYAIMGALLLLISEYFIGVLFLIIGALWFVFWPRWEKRHYIKHYKSFIEENYKERIGRVTILEISDDVLLAKENGNEAKLLTSEVDEIVEISTLIFIRIKGGQAFILPKDQISNVNDVVVRLKDLASHLNVKYSTEIEWEWK